MQSSNRDFQAAQEIGKIYQSLTDKKTLCEFFVESAANFVEAKKGYLFLLGRNDQLWLEASILSSATESVSGLAQKKAEEVILSGKPYFNSSHLAMPLLVRNSVIGVASFERVEGQSGFVQDDLDIALALGAQVAGALKNTLLFEENLRMTKMAAIGQTTGMVLHEIKNIMQLAKLSFDFVNKGVNESNEKFLNRGLSNMKRALRELEGFTMDMLSLAKDYALEAKPVSMQKILNNLNDDLQGKAKDMEIELIFEIDEAFPQVDADESALYRMLLNIIKNAVEAYDMEKEQSYVKVNVTSKDENLYQVCIEDNGVGMSPEVRARLFEAFFSTKGKQGTGLGLMIMERTVRLHRGDIQVESEEGKWTRFRLILPKKLKANS